MFWMNKLGKACAELGLDGNTMTVEESRELTVKGLQLKKEGYTPDLVAIAIFLGLCDTKFSRHPEDWIVPLARGAERTQVWISEGRLPQEYGDKCMSKIQVLISEAKANTSNWSEL